MFYSVFILSTHDFVYMILCGLLHIISALFDIVYS